MNIFPSSETDGFDQEAETHSLLVPIQNSSVPTEGVNFFMQHILVGHLYSEQAKV